MKSQPDPSLLWHKDILANILTLGQIETGPESNIQLCKLLNIYVEYMWKTSRDTTICFQQQ